MAGLFPVRRCPRRAIRSSWSSRWAVTVADGVCFERRIRGRRACYDGNPNCSSPVAFSFGSSLHLLEIPQMVKLQHVKTQISRQRGLWPWATSFSSNISNHISQSRVFRFSSFIFRPKNAWDFPIQTITSTFNTQRTGVLGKSPHLSYLYLYCLLLPLSCFPT